MTVRSITLYYQTDAETGGNAGWAYNVIDREGDHTSGGFEVGEDDDGSESLSDVRSAFGRVWPEAYAQIPLESIRVNRTSMDNGARLAGGTVTVVSCARCRVTARADDISELVVAGWERVWINRAPYSVVAARRWMCKSCRDGVPYGR